MNFESLKPAIWLWALIGLLAQCAGCVTSTEVLYADPEFSETLREFDRLHSANELPGLGSHEVPKSLSAYNMSEPYMQRSYYVLWREASRDCTISQVVVARKVSAEAYAYFFCLDDGVSNWMGTLYQMNYKASWNRLP